MRKLSKKAIAAWESRFAAAVKKFLDDRNAVLIDDYPHPVFNLKTRAGNLQVTPYNNWLACRFDDEKLAKTVLGDDDPCRRLNPFSGKWNHHFSFEHDIDDCIRSLEFEFKKVMDASDNE